MKTQFEVFAMPERRSDIAEVHQCAVDLVAAKLAKLQAVRERMRKVNALIRNRNAKGLKRLGYARSKVARFLRAEGVGACGSYTAHKLRTNYQQIVTLRRMSRKLEAAVQRDVTVDEDGYQYREDVTAKTVHFQFTAKPDKALRAILRRAGFVIGTNRNTYERALDDGGIEAALQVRDHIANRSK